MMDTALLSPLKTRRPKKDERDEDGRVNGGCRGSAFGRRRRLADDKNNDANQWLRVYQMVFDAMQHSHGGGTAGGGAPRRQQLSSASGAPQLNHAHVHSASSASSSSSTSSALSLSADKNSDNNNSAYQQSDPQQQQIQLQTGPGSGLSGADGMCSAADGWQRQPLLRHGGAAAESSEEDEGGGSGGADEGDGGARRNGGVVMWQQYSTTVSIGGGDEEELNSAGHKLMNGTSNGGGGANGGLVKISLPPPERDDNKFPKEKWKTFLSFLWVSANFVLTTGFLAVVHERLPDRNAVPPLPDVVFDLFPPQDWALAVSEVLIIVSVNTCLLAIFLHKHRFILLRRAFLILGVLYLMRCITMFVTQVPVASTTYYCSPKANSTSPTVVIQRMLQLISGFGLSINGQHTYCGDYIYSGHTVILTMSYMIIKEYTPRRCSLLHWLSWLTSVTGVVMVLLSRGHYTVDVLIAYYVTTRVFWIYHTMANNQHLKVSGGYNYLSKVWWFCMFEYFERNIGGVVPRTYECPIPWPRRFVKRDRDS